MIARQGGPADKFFIVADGEVEVERARRTATGASPLWRRASSSARCRSCATARARRRSRPRRPTTLLAMERDTFRDLVAQSLGTTGEFDQMIRRRLRVARRRLRAPTRRRSMAATTAEQAFTSKDFRDALGAFATGRDGGHHERRGARLRHDRQRLLLASRSTRRWCSSASSPAPRAASTSTATGCSRCNILARRAGAALALLLLQGPSARARRVPRGRTHVAVTGSPILDGVVGLPGLPAQRQPHGRRPRDLRRGGPDPGQQRRGGAAPLPRRVLPLPARGLSGPAEVRPRRRPTRRRAP